MDIFFGCFCFWIVLLLVKHMWLDEKIFEKHTDSKGDYIMMNGEKWYVGPSLNQEAEDDDMDWMDGLIIALCLVIIAFLLFLVYVNF
jgi:hypothetical protein